MHAIVDCRSDPQVISTMMAASRYSDRASRCQKGGSMYDGMIIAVLIVGGVVVYVIAKVIAYSRKSDAQWQAVDKSKLKTWDDDEDD
jgi:hypothetical protein